MLQTRSLPGGGRGRNGLVSSETWHITKQGLTCWRGGRGRSGLASSEMWHVAKWGLTCWRGGRGRSGLVSSETWHGTKRGLTCWRGESVGEAGVGALKKGAVQKGRLFLEGGRRAVAGGT